MERHCDHGFDLIQIHFHTTIVISDLSRIQFFILFASAVNCIILFNLVICSPDRGQAGGLCGHNIHADTEIRTQIGYARSHKFHYFILHIAIGKYFSDNGQSHVLRTYARSWRPGQIDCHYLRHIDIVGLFQQLFHQLRSAFAHGHGSQSSITGMTVRTQDHLASTSQHFPCELMNDCLMRRHIDTAVFFRTGQSKHVIIFVNSTAHCTERIMTVGQHIRNGESFQTGSSRRLDNTHKCDIVRCELIKLNLQFFHIIGSIVLLQNTISNGILFSFFTGYRKVSRCLFHKLISIHQKYALVMQFNHNNPPFCNHCLACCISKSFWLHPV